jgi:hypothetical protein
MSNIFFAAAFIAAIVVIAVDNVAAVDDAVGQQDEAPTPIVMWHGMGTHVF